MTQKEAKQAITEEFKEKEENFSDKVKYKEIFCEICEKDRMHYVFTTTNNVYYVCSVCNEVIPL